MRVRRKPWTAGELAANPKIVRDPEQWKGRWHGYFKNENPIQLEIGCGKGQFIAAAADAYPQTNFIALERNPAILAAAARKGLQASENAHLAYINSDVKNLPAYFAPGDIQALYIQFCDPWPNKKKWAKRRLTHARFLELYRQLAIDVIFFKTDDRKLFEFSLEQFSEQARWLMKNISLDLYADTNAGQPAGDARFMTEYEEKFVSLGTPIYRLEAYGKALGGLSDERAKCQDQKPCPASVVSSPEKQNPESGKLKQF
ncbi:MAG: tRNA (guanosine(46)-N7)-methyltransferase TrmB [Clostridiales bacterium]|jgi:tRNA (guanine-N7-)-methyltransferase|nr:tRNA (guanosine(46)-N7)-methyltransferase TrmB [Clostridiales bacterium]